MPIDQPKKQIVILNSNKRKNSSDNDNEELQRYKSKPKSNPTVIDLNNSESEYKGENLP